MQMCKNANVQICKCANVKNRTSFIYHRDYILKKLYNNIRFICRFAGW